MSKLFKVTFPISLQAASANPSKEPHETYVTGLDWEHVAKNYSNAQKIELVSDKVMVLRNPKDTYVPTYALEALKSAQDFIINNTSGSTEERKQGMYYKIITAAIEKAEL